jgi:uncharacterized protein (DUF433 family)
MSVELDSLLTHSPDVRHDRVRIAGTGITVHRIAVLSNLGHGPEEIVRKYKHLTLAGVHAALAYYHANREQIDAEIVGDQSEAARLEAEFARAPQVA